MKNFWLLAGLLLIFPSQSTQAKMTPLTTVIKQAEGGDLPASVALAHRRFHSLGDSRERHLIYQAFSDGTETGLADAYAGLALCLSAGFSWTSTHIVSSGFPPSSAPQEATLHSAALP